ncbi:uncharacterized protein LOC143281699 [Babylonia areolata]|uniref:uncharacterized protein LOC143281699 n=1 Tax=Babylonia areolata TaxID=304850 RepID=UPI003FCFA6AE
MKFRPKRGGNAETSDSDVGKTDDESSKTHDASAQPDDANTRPGDANTRPDDANTRPDVVSGTETGDDDSSSVYAPDGGWGWLVTVAGFLVAFIQDGIVTSFGLMLPELMDTFGTGVSLTSLPPGILVATFLLSGPVTAYLVERWGCRLVGFCGGLVAALGVAGSAYAPSIHLFILSFGVVAGVGVGLIYLPSVTMVNMYFHKKRGVVAGIITSGSGFGLLALAPLTEMLMEQYGWRGCYLIMAAITLHLCVCASLMRPLPHRPSSPSPSHTEGVVVEAKENSCPFLQGECDLSLVSVQELKNTTDRDQLAPATHLEGDGQGVNNLHPKTLFRGENGHCVSSHPPHKLCKDKDNSEFSLVEESHHRSHVHVCSADLAGPIHTLLVRSRSQGHLESRPSHRPHHPPLPVNVLSTWLACQVPPSLSRHTLHSHQSSDNIADQNEPSSQQKGNGLMVPHVISSAARKRSPHHNEGRTDWVRSLPSVRVTDSMVKQTVDWKPNGTSPLHDKAAAEKETHREKEAAGCPLLQPDGSHNEEDPASAGYEGRLRRWLRSQVEFILFLLGAFLIQLICYVPPLLTPSYAYDHGISKEQVATILSIYGLLNTGGRLLAGVMVYWGVRTLHVYNLGTLLSAVACFVFPLATSFPSIAACLGLHGFFLGAFPPLQSVILVEYLGLERLTSTFGIMCLVKAFACMAGAPLAGLLFTVTGTYTVPLAVCGAVLVVAAIFHQLMDCWP